VLIAIGLLGCAGVGLLALVLFGSLATVSYIRMQRVAQMNAVKSQVDMLADAVHLYMLHVGNPPTQQQGLQALVTRPSDLPDPQKWQGPYLDPSVARLDPWNQPYQYEVLDAFSGSFRIWSNGPDLRPGTADDISSLPD
jgi:general secretion pathway protein G